RCQFESTVPHSTLQRLCCGLAVRLRDRTIRLPGTRLDLHAVTLAQPPWQASGKLPQPCWAVQVPTTVSHPASPTSVTSRTGMGSTIPVREERPRPMGSPLRPSTCRRDRVD